MLTQMHDVRHRVKELKGVHMNRESAVGVSVRSYLVVTIRG